MHIWLDAITRLPDDHATFARRTIVVLLIAEAALCLIAATSLVMLHGDGAFFVYAITTGTPWALKWSAIEARTATYLLTVVPTQVIAETFQLTARHVAAVNGLLFNAIPVIQLLVVITLAWRRHAGLLIFPVAQYAFATGMGFGFVSEMMLAPGFFWICMFLLLQRPLPVIPFALSYAGLVFSHELAIPGALLIAAFAWMQARNDDASLRQTTRIILGCCGAILIAWLTVRIIAGGAGSDNNAKYVLDPRRILNNPTLWLITLSTLAIAVWSWRTKAVASTQTLLVVACVSVLGTMALERWLNFADGRYDSARTLMSVAMLVLGAGFALTRLRKPSTTPGPADAVLRSAMPLALTAALAINFAASTSFLWDWNNAREGFEELAARNGNDAPAFNFVTFDQARPMISAEKARANDRMGFAWTWPYRSLMLAENYKPGTVVFHPNDITVICPELRASPRQGGLIPPESIQNMETFSCSQPTPPPYVGLYARFMQRLRAVLGLTPTQN